MTKRFVTGLVAAVAACLTIVLVFFSGRSPSGNGRTRPAEAPATTPVPAATPTPAPAGSPVAAAAGPEASPGVRVDPLHDLDRMIKVYVSGASATQDKENALAESKRKAEEFKASGGTMWKSEDWMLPREAYRQMDTVALTSDVLSRPIYGMEIGLFEDPRVGIQRLTLLHEGFAEMIGRGDLWKGILEHYNSAEDDIALGLAPERIVTRAINLSRLSSLFLHHPALKQQVKGREKELVRAQVKSLEAFARYLNDAEGRNWEEVGLFFEEPVTVCETALVLMKSGDEASYSTIVSELSDITLSETQDPAELKAYVEKAVDLIKTVYLQL